MLLVGSSGHTPIALVVLHKHTYRNGLASPVLECHVEEFARAIKIGIHCRRQFSVFRLYSYGNRKVYHRVVYDDIIIVVLLVIIHKQHNHLTLSVIAYLRISRIRGIVDKWTCRNLCHILYILVTLQLRDNIIWNDALGSHQSTLLERKVTIMQDCIGRVLLIGQLIYPEIVQELACNREPGIVECRLCPGETWIGGGEIGCIVAALLGKSRHSRFIIVYICYIVERWRISRIADVEETRALAKIVTGVVEIGKIGLCCYPNTVVSLGQKAERAALCTLLEGFEEHAAAITLGSRVILAEHIVEVGLCQYT